MSEGTITITIDEYFDLRQKAETNGLLMVELGQMRERMDNFDRRIWELEQPRLRKE